MVETIKAKRRLIIPNLYEVDRVVEGAISVIVFMIPMYLLNLETVFKYVVSPDCYRDYRSFLMGYEAKFLSIASLRFKILTK